MSLKVHAFIAQAGITSRRKAEELILKGKVQVNGKNAVIGQRIDPKKDLVMIDQQVVNPQTNIVTYLINKPVGIVSTTSDELGRKTVNDFLQSKVAEDVKLPRLYPVGRLDMESEGLMVLTNDGNLAQYLTHPSNEVPKTYHIVVEGKPTFLALRHLERGVKLREGMTSPALIELLEAGPDQTKLAITIHEGWNHQVRRMMLRVGYKVITLVRVRIGDYTLDQLQDQPYLLVK